MVFDELLSLMALPVFLRDKSANISRLPVHFMGGGPFAQAPCAAAFGFALFARLAPGPKISHRRMLRSCSGTSPERDVFPEWLFWALLRQRALSCCVSLLLHPVLQRAVRDDDVQPHGLSLNGQQLGAVFLALRMSRENLSQRGLFLARQRLGHSRPENVAANAGHRDGVSDRVQRQRDCAQKKSQSRRSSRRPAVRQPTWSENGAQTNRHAHTSRAHDQTPASARLFPGSGHLRF